jgi:hypothetical protein
MKWISVSRAVLVFSMIAVFLISSLVLVLQGVMSAGTVTFAATPLLGRPTDTSVTVNVVPSSNGQVYY